MYTPFFKEAEKLRNSSNFVAWKIMLEIIVNDNDSILDIIFASHTELLLNSPMVVPRLGTLMPPVLEAKVRVLTTYRSNFRESLLFHVVKFLLIHQISKHSHTFNGGQTRFDQEDMIGSIYLDLKVVCYEFLLNHLQLPA